MDANTIPTDSQGNKCKGFPQCGCTYRASCHYLNPQGNYCSYLPSCDCSLAFHCAFYVEPEPERIEPWIGVDLDGCLAEYDGWKGVLHIGAPVPKMVQRVKTMLVQGKNVKIFTARCWTDENIKRKRESLAAIRAIELWCEEHIGQALPVTCTKDPGMVNLFDDRAIQVEQNTGDTLEDKLWRLANPVKWSEPTNPREG